MNVKQIQKEKNYRLALYLVKLLMQRKIITASEYESIRKKLLKKYKPPFGDLW